MQEIMTAANTEIMAGQSITSGMMQDFINFIDATTNSVSTYTRGVKQLYAYLA